MHVYDLLEILVTFYFTHILQLSIVVDVIFVYCSCQFTSMKGHEGNNLEGGIGSQGNTGTIQKRRN